MADPVHFLKDLVDEVNSLRDPCRSTYLSPSGIRRLFLLLLRGHWSGPENHGSDLKDSLSCLIWDADEKISQVDIELQGTDRARNSGPAAIFIKVGNFQFERVSFGARSEVSDDNAEVIYTYQTTCQALFVHEHPSLDVAYDMAWSTFSFFSGYAEAVSSIIGQDTWIEPKVLGEPQMSKDKPDERYRVDFGMEIKVSISVSTTLESHRLKRAFDLFTPQLS